MDATIRLVAREGMRGFRYRAVAREAGVAHPLIAHHFGTLDALLGAAMDESLLRSTSQLDLIPAHGLVSEFARGFVDGVESLSQILVFQYHVMVEQQADAQSIQLFDRVHGAYRETLSDALSMMGCATDVGLVELVYATLEGIVFHQLMRGGSDASHAALDRLRSFLETQTI